VRRLSWRGRPVERSQDSQHRRAAQAVRHVPAELDAIADHVAKLPPSPPAGGAIDEARYQRGAKLAQERICASCHNPDYSGREQMARLAGQHPEYTLKALQDFRAGIRIGTQAAMPETVRGLDDEALADLAHYLAHFRP
jgi:cytochrome c553